MLMRTLLIRPGGPESSQETACLEPLGLERVAAALRAMGHDARILDLRVSTQRDLQRELRDFRPEAAGFGVNRLANVPRALDLAKRIKHETPGCFAFAGGHGVSPIAGHVLGQAGGALDAVVRGEGEVAAPLLLAAARDGGLSGVPGAVTTEGTCHRTPLPLDGIEAPRPARDLLRGREKYVIGALTPAAAIELGRGDRTLSPRAAAAELATIREWYVYIVDDTAFVRPEHGEAVARELERRRVRKRYCVRTGAEVLLAHPDLFRRWQKLGLKHLVLNVETLERDGAERDIKALELARDLRITVTIDLSVDPGWDAGRFRLLRAWARSMPETIHLTVMTPYPGAAGWTAASRRLTTRDYRLFDGAHAVVPTTLPLDRFYRELALTRAMVNRKQPGVSPTARRHGALVRGLLRGPSGVANGFRGLRSVYDAERGYRDHLRAGPYALPVPAEPHLGGADLPGMHIHRRPH